MKPWSAPRRRPPGVLLLSLLALAAAACGDAGEVSEKPPSSHERLLAELREIRDRAAVKNPYLGEGETRSLRARLAGLPAGAPPADRWLGHLELGMSELKLGNEDEAIRELEAAYALLPELEDDLAREGLAETTYRLGVANLRRGETQNCCLRHSPESCILPIREGGRHERQEGSRRAIRHFTEVLRNMPPGSSFALRSRWLLNIAHMTLGSWPDGVPEPDRIGPEVFASGQEFPRFPNVAGKAGLDALLLSGGAIADDFDNDGYLDLAVSTLHTAEPLRLYRNERDGTFRERGAAAGLSGLFGGLNLVQADYDDDGWTDILVLRGAWFGSEGLHPDSLLHNNGDGTFTDVTFAAGLGDRAPSQTGAWADYDNDGDLDLYVGNEHVERASYRAPGRLYRNDGAGSFTDVAASAGVENLRFAKAAVWGDYDGDRYPDLYVSNLGAPNRLYHNQRDGTFTDVAERLGVSLPLESFPAWFWDFDNDGALDLYVATYRGDTGALASVAASYLGLPLREELGRLYRGDGRGGFQDVAVERGLGLYTVAMGSNFGDLDGDGWLDFYLGTGYPDYEGLIPNVMYRNDAGQRFVDVTTAGGFGHLQKGHGVAFADLDNDGDQDVFEQMGGGLLGDRYRAALYENPGFGNRWIAIRLVGTCSNRSAIGARIRVEVVERGRPRSIYRHVSSGGSFGANPLRQTIGLGRAERITRLEIVWPTSELTQTFEDVALDQHVEIVEGDDTLRRLDLARLTLGGNERLDP